MFESIEASLQNIDEEAEFIPLLSSEDEEEINNESLPETLAILSLKNTVLFPGVVIPITAGRDTSIQLLEDANKTDRILGVVAQKDKSIESPELKDIHTTGVVARILKILKMPDGNTTVILQGKKRFQIKELTQTKPYLRALVDDIPEKRPDAKDSEFNAIVDSIKELALRIIHHSPNIPSESSFAIKNIDSKPFLINFISSNLPISLEEKQTLLEILDLKERALATLKIMNIEFQKLQLKNDIQSRVQNDLNQQQREYFLQQQIKTIQDELGGTSIEAEVEEMQQKAESINWNEEVATHFDKELNKLRRMNPQASDFGVQRSYLELFLELPWGVYSKDSFDLKKAQKILDKEHFGLKDVKERIIEYLAVLKLRNDMKSPILCLQGPPGVGKTSLGKSVAKALGREYVRISLGGLRDESEIRGHRKTYIGAMPGRIIQSLKKAKTSNPVFVLDEIDKLSNGYQGDPSSALLEVLDPEQNTEFYDNFLEIGFDLSKVLFIATSNNLGAIQPALRDRMEIIYVSGYTLEEKIEIAKRHLLSKQLKEHGLTKTDVKIIPTVLSKIIEGYTRESGVRGLERQVAKVVRNTAKNIVMEQEYNTSISKKDIEQILGHPKVVKDLYENNETAGVVTGLAWTAVGGDILFIESLLTKGKGALSLTGNLGKVMKESATIALEYVKSNADLLGVDPKVIEEHNVHIHVPEGATPKDGPSAGITILTSLVSLFTQKRVKSRLAMTGEITLRGKVLAVGGIKEKILAAKRAQVKEIILSQHNKKDILEIDQEYLKGLKFYYVDTMNEVIDIAIINTKVKNAKKFIKETV